MLLFATILSLGLGCTSTEGKEETAVDSESHTGSDAGTDTGSAQVPTGCVRGLLRTYSNTAFASGRVRAFTHPPCVQRSETLTNGDGTWCLEGIPVGQTLEVQVEFGTSGGVEDPEARCAWWHAQDVTPVPPGSCDKPETCREMETWFECTPVGGTASCL